jgi:hypothetical protein
MKARVRIRTVVIVVVVVVALVSLPAWAVDVEALVRGIDTVPSPETVAALDDQDLAALLAVADDVHAPLVHRVRALRLAAGAAAPAPAAFDAAVDDVIARWLVSSERELRVQAAWAAVERAKRARRDLDVAGELLTAADPALREVGALALWREGSPAAREQLEARLAREHDVDVATVLRARLARWPRASVRAPTLPSSARQRRR